MAVWLSDNEVDFILQQGQLQVIEEPLWRVQGGSLKMTAPVANSQDLDLQLVATSNPRTGRYSFGLIYPAANQALRRYCSSGMHRNPGERRSSIRGPHKHNWSAATEDHVAYVPTDITADTISGRARQFLQECRVTCTVDIPEPPEGPASQLSF